MNQPIPRILLDVDDKFDKVTDDADTLMGDIFNEEIEEGLRAVAINKTPGLEFIPVELLK